MDSPLTVWTTRPCRICAKMHKAADFPKLAGFSILSVDMSKRQLDGTADTQGATKRARQDSYPQCCRPIAGSKHLLVEWPCESRHLSCALCIIQAIRQATKWAEPAQGPLVLPHRELTCIVSCPRCQSAPLNIVNCELVQLKSLPPDVNCGCCSFPKC